MILNGTTLNGSFWSSKNLDWFLFGGSRFAVDLKSVSLKVREKPQKLKESYWLMAQVELNFNGGVTVLAGDVEVKEKFRCWFNGFANLPSEQISVITLGCLIQERGSK